jgi:hypothetical protein
MDALPKARTFNAVVVKLATIKGGSTFTQPSHIGPSPEIRILFFIFCAIAHLTQHCGVPQTILIVISTVVRLI